MMTKTLTYSALSVAIIVVATIFLTSITYPQLITAICLYAILIYSALMVFPRKIQVTTKRTNHNISQMQRPNETKEAETAEKISGMQPAYIADIDKRTFLKLLGATGISFFLVSLLGRRVDSLFFGNSDQPSLIQGGNNQANQPNASPTAGYSITEVDETSELTFYGFTSVNQGWLIMRETEDGNSFRYAKGNSDFPANWQNRANLKYDYLYNLTHI